MAARITVSDLRIVLDTRLNDLTLAAFIDHAHLWVDNYLVDQCPDLPEDKLPVIETYLAAHFATVGDPRLRLRSMQLDDVREAYAVPEERASQYLRAAAGFDPCGIIEDRLIVQEDRQPVRFHVGAGYDD